MSKETVEKEINSLIKERLFAAIRKIIVAKKKESFMRSAEYRISSNQKNLLDKRYKMWYNSVSSLFLSYKTIIALKPLVDREKKINDFRAQEVIRVKADYSYNGFNFSAFYPTHFNKSMTTEIEDCISELRSSKYTHIVEAYIEKESEKSPHEPLTTATLKFGAFYLYGISPSSTSEIAEKLFEAGLITNPKTNGWNIDASIVEDIISALYTYFSEKNVVLNAKREYIDHSIDRTLTECIRPTIIASNYFPKEIENSDEFKSIKFQSAFQKKEALEIYTFIYYITLSTQMKNSIYDVSTIDIQVGPKILKERSHTIVKGSENWEILTGSLLKRINKNSDSSFENETVLPNIKNNTYLIPLDVYSYSYQSKRPPRYGVGRFITQILEKKGIGKNDEHDAIVEDLISTKCVLQIKSMLHPQDVAIAALDWIEEFAPSLLNKEYIDELDEKITMVVNKEIEIETLLDEINRVIDFAFEQSGFILDDSKPSDKKIRLANKIAYKNSVTITQEMLSSNVKLDMFIAQYPEEKQEKIGTCPSCSSAVIQKDYLDEVSGEIINYFACEKASPTGCGFSIWESSIKKFFSIRGIELLGKSEPKEMLMKILSKKKGYHIDGFISKNKKDYSAKVLIGTYIDNDHNEKFKLDLAFTKQKNNKKVA